MKSNLARIVTLVIVTTCSALIGGPQSARAQLVRAQGLPPIDAATREAVVDSMTIVIDSVYVIEDGARQIISGLRQRLADGEYDDLTDPVEFADRLEADAQAIHHDGHFSIRVMPPLPPEYAGEGRDPEEMAQRQRFRTITNYGFRKAEILQGGVGYLRFDSFMVEDGAEFEAAAAAMGFLANSDAVILDLRWNGGGAASMIRFLAGYFFEEQAHLINWYQRAVDQTVQSYSADYVPGARLVDRPLYILTSRRTGSAAEEFTFDMRNLERATVVGETTAGAGHTVSGHVFDFPNFRLELRVPYGRAYDPKTGEGWEGIGVAPHLAVPADEALETAYADALRNLMEQDPEGRIRASRQWALQDLDARHDPPELTARELKEYAGNYGPRRVFYEDGALHYQRPPQPSHRLEPIARDLFRLGDVDFFRLGFERDSSGRIVKAVGHYDNGHRDENERESD